MLLAPLGLMLVAAAYKTLQVRAAREWPSTAGQGGDFEGRDARGQGDRRATARGHRSRSATSPTSFTNIRSRAGNCATTASASARIAEISRSPKPSRNIRSAPSSPSITTRCIRDQAVLERDLPKGLWGCLGIGTAIVLAIVFGSAIGLHAITEFVTTRIAQSRERRGGRRASARSVPRSRCLRWCCTGRRRWQ